MPTPLVIFVGPIARHFPLARDLILAGSVVVLAPTVESVKNWLGEHLPDGADQPNADVVEIGRLVVDRSAHRAVWGELLLPLTEQELQLLGALADPPRRAWSFDELLLRVWGTRLGGRATVGAAVRRLRRKLDAAGATVRIEAVRGVGFRLDC